MSNLILLSIDYPLYQGSYTECPLFYPTFDDEGLHVETDITGATINCNFRKTASSPVLLTLDTTDKIVITDAAKGEFKLTFPSDFTSTIKEKQSFLMKGHVEVTLSGITKRTHEIYLYFSPEFT